MTVSLRRELATLDLPQPLEPLVYRALGESTGSGRHAALLDAWETTIQVAAASVSAACLALGLRSEAFAHQLQGLKRPGFGTWVGLLREGAALVSQRQESEALLVAELAQGLAAPLPGEVAGLLDDTDGSLHLEGPSALDVVHALPAYRNRVRGHTETSLPEVTLGQHADVLLRLLLAWCRVAPPAGTGRWTLVRGLVQRADGDAARHEADLLDLHGSAPLASRRVISAGLAGRLRRGDVVLLGEREVCVSLAPLAFAVHGDSGWCVGLLKGRMKRPTLLYGGHDGPGFRADVDEAMYAALTVVVDEAAAPVSAELEPYRGLLAYGEEHAAIFFGRDCERRRLVEMLVGDGVALICGPSGSGKSSLMHAGAIPDLRDAMVAADRTLTVVRWTPGDAPLAALERALAEPGLAEKVRSAPPEGFANALGSTSGRVVLAVDQLEELVTASQDPAASARSLDLLTACVAAAGPNLSVVATVRADLVGTLFDHPGTRDLFARHTLAVGAMEAEDLVSVIRGPLAGRDVKIEDGLAEQIAADVGDEPGALALLSQVLTTLWESRGSYGNRLTREGYTAAGGVDGALARRGDAAWAEVPDADGGLLERVLLRLASVTNDGKLVRQRAAADELAESCGVSVERVRALVAPLVAARLLVWSGAEDAARLEVAHEALLRSWPRLNGLLLSEREAVTVRQQVAAAARRWDESGRRSELWTDAGVRLSHAEELFAGGRLQLTGRETAFLKASRARQKLRRRLLGLAVALFAVLTVVGVVNAVRADAARAVAAESTNDAEELVAYLVDALPDALDSTGRLDIAAGLFERMDAYYGEAEDEQGALTLAQMKRHATVLSELLQVHMALLDLRAAVGIVFEVRPIYQELAAREPNNPRWQRDLVFLDTLLSAVNATRSPSEEANQQLMDRYYALLDAVDADEAEEEERLRAAGSCWAVFAIVFSSGTDSHDDLMHLVDRCQDRMRAWAGDRLGEDVDWTILYANIRRRAVEGVAASAEEEITSVRAIADELAALEERHPEHRPLILESAQALNALAYSYYSLRGDLESSLDAARQAVDRFRLSARLDPQNQQIVNAMVFGYTRLGYVLGESGRYLEAMELLAEAYPVTVGLADGTLDSATTVEARQGMFGFACWLGTVVRSAELPEDACARYLDETDAWIEAQTTFSVVAFAAEFALGELALRRRDWDAVLERTASVVQDEYSLDDLADTRLSVAFGARLLAFAWSARAVAAYQAGADIDFSHAEAQMAQIVARCADGCDVEFDGGVRVGTYVRALSGITEGLAAMDRGDATAAIDALTSAAAMLREDIGDAAYPVPRAWAALALEMAGEIATEAGMADRAEAAYRQAIAELEPVASLDPPTAMAASLALVRWRLAELVADRPDGEALELLVQARDALTSMAARDALAPAEEPWLAGVEAALEATP